MAWRFSRRVKLAPGVTLNVGKRGVSATVGVRGAGVTVRQDGGASATVGLPGTGLSMTERLRADGVVVDGQTVGDEQPKYKPNARRGQFYIVVIIVVLALVTYKLIRGA